MQGGAGKKYLLGTTLPHHHHLTPRHYHAAHIAVASVPTDETDRINARTRVNGYGNGLACHTCGKRGLQHDLAGDGAEGNLPAICYPLS
ncbi:hypothetical protein C7N43_08935 [Sphingobacteriales bacterium UPWRP_1]|nr:hypothetical protein C7N43_08935 [Sphingobacteriales bacterium UPWRP_1]